MSFQINQNELQKFVALAAKINKGKTSGLIIDNLMIHFGPGGFQVETTDLQNWLTVSTEGFDKSKTQSALVKAKQFVPVVANIAKDTQIEISCAEKFLTLSTGTAKHRFSLDPQLSSWPSLASDIKMRPMHLSGKELNSNLRFVLPAVSTEADQTRPMLAGINVRPKNGFLRFIGCDGRVMAQSVIEMHAPPDLPEAGFIIPRPMSQLIIDLLADFEAEDKVELSFSNSRFCLNYEDTCTVQLVGKLTDATYYSIDHLISVPLERKVNTLPREATIHALRRAATFMHEKHRAVRMKFADGKVAITTNNENGNSDESISLSQQEHDCEILGSLPFLGMALQSFEYDDLSTFTGRDDLSIYIADKDDGVSTTGKFYLVLLMKK